MDKILVFVEIKGDEVKKASMELLSEGMRLAQAGRYTVEAVTLGRLPPASRKSSCTMQIRSCTSRTLSWTRIHQKDMD